MDDLETMDPLQEAALEFVSDYEILQLTDQIKSAKDQLPKAKEEYKSEKNKCKQAEIQYGESVENCISVN